MFCDLQMLTIVTFYCSFVWFIMNCWKKSHVDRLFNKQKACCYNWHKGYNIGDSRNLEGAEDIMRKCTMNEKLQEFEIKISWQVHSQLLYQTFWQSVSAQQSISQVSHTQSFSHSCNHAVSRSVYQYCNHKVSQSVSHVIAQLVSQSVIV